MNDSIQLDIDYSGDIDEANFNFVLLYNYDIVATKPFYYNEFQ